MTLCTAKELKKNASFLRKIAIELKVYLGALALGVANVFFTAALCSLLPLQRDDRQIWTTKQRIIFTLILLSDVELISEMLLTLIHVVFKLDTHSNAFA